MRARITVTILLGLVWMLGPAPALPEPPAGNDDGRILYYRSPMDPTFISRESGKDAMGMDLVPVRAGDPDADLDRIRVSGAVIQRSGIRVEKVRRGRPTRLVRALGRVELDETRVSKINMKFDGWIERLWVDETGQYVAKGAPLFAVYSPELLASQEELVQVLKASAEGPHTEHLVRSARQRLLQFDVPGAFVAQLEKDLTPRRQVVIPSPQEGYVIHKTAYEGTFVKKGEGLFTLGDLDALWVIAEVYEQDAPWVRVGQLATIELDYLPGRTHEAKVDYVYPVLDEKTRTIEVRLRLPNPDVALKPGMFATVRIHTEPSEDTLLVPSEAVIHSGERHVAFVYLGDGVFDPRELVLGVRGDDDYEVEMGLSEGEEVVVSGQFLLDSESRLKEAVKKMLGGNLAPTSEEHAGGSHAGTGH